MVANINIAILGATGLVGQTMLQILEEQNFSIGKLYALASIRSEGKTVVFNNKAIQVENVAQFDFTKVQIALFSAGSAVSQIYAPLAAQAGCIVIDNTSAFRYDSEVPLIIPEVNPEVLSLYKKRNIIANPNCSTIQMLVALKPIYDAVGISRINVATYQSVSGTGTQAINELMNQTSELLQGRPIDNPQCYGKQIAFNVLAACDIYQPNGYTKEEMKMHWETQKILEDDAIQVNATSVRVPVFYGHSEAIHIETKEKLSALAAKKLLENAPGVIVIDGSAENFEYPTPFEQATGTDGVYVGRIREDFTHSTGLNLWVVADNIRKGAALNSIQIAQMLLKYI